MKKLLTLLFSILISFNSYGEWSEVSIGVSSGNTTYLDNDTIREKDGYVYFWSLQDRVKPNDYGDMSIKTYWQGDCDLKKMRSLTNIFFPQPMGEGIPETDYPPREWQYQSPGSVGEGFLDYACDYVK